MIIAATYEDGKIFQHFGKTEQFKLYTVEDGRAQAMEVRSPGGEGHGALAGVLKSWGVQALLCGGIGPGAQQTLSDEGIEFYSGLAGEADSFAEEFAKGTLPKNEGASCAGHGHSHSCGGH